MSDHQKDSDRVKISSGGAYESVFGYSRAVRAGADVHVSGTCAPVGHEKSSAYEQARAALSIIEKALADAGASFADVLWSTCAISMTRKRSQKRISKPSTRSVQLAPLFK
jgi:enamine deaminase RidA (YjgF/YER057c/UK114 family)